MWLCLRTPRRSLRPRSPYSPPSPLPPPPLSLPPPPPSSPPLLPPSPLPSSPSHPPFPSLPPLSPSEWRAHVLRPEPAAFFLPSSPPFSPSSSPAAFPFPLSSPPLLPPLPPPVSPSPPSSPPPSLPPLPLLSPPSLHLSFLSLSPPPLCPPPSLRGPPAGAVAARNCARGAETLQTKPYLAGERDTSSPLSCPARGLPVAERARPCSPHPLPRRAPSPLAALPDPRAALARSEIALMRRAQVVARAGRGGMTVRGQ